MLSVIGSLTADPAVPRRGRWRSSSATSRGSSNSSPGSSTASAASTPRHRRGRRRWRWCWASLGVFNAMTSAVNHAWGVERRRSFLSHRLFSFLMMLSAGGMFVVAIVMVSAMPRWPDALVRRAGPAGGAGTGTSGVRRQPAGATLLLIVCVGADLLLHAQRARPLPRRLARRHARRAAVAAAFSAFSWYAADLARGTIHGSVADRGGLPAVDLRVRR